MAVQLTSDMVLRLTACQEPNALARTVVWALHSYLVGAQVRYYDLEGGGLHLALNANERKDTVFRDLLDDQSGAIPMEEKPDWSRAVQDNEWLVSKENGVPVLVVPIASGRHAVGVFVIEGMPTGESDREFVSLTARILGNLMWLVRRNEQDTLTGLYNRRAFESRAHRILDYAGRRATDKDDSCAHLCCAMIDIDQLRDVNAELGYMYGDEVVLHTGQMISRCFRVDDVLCRYAGGQFIVLLRDVALDLAMLVLDRFRKNMEEYRHPQAGIRTISIGVIEITQRELLTHIIDKAAKALQFAKQGGGNGVQAYEYLPVAVTQDLGNDSLNSSAGEVELF